MAILEGKVAVVTGGSHGIGAVGTTTLGIRLFQESANIIRLGWIALVVVGIAGLAVVRIKINFD